MDKDFMNRVQAAGWKIDKCSEDVCAVSCGSAGCDVRLGIRKGQPIPDRSPVEFTQFPGTPITKWAPMRDELVRLRECRGLTIDDVEEASGLAIDHIAKMEPVGSKKIPNIESLIIWAGALGVQLYWSRVDLPQLTLRLMADSRQEQAKRAKRINLANRRRDARR